MNYNDIFNKLNMQAKLGLALFYDDGVDANRLSA